MVENLFGGNVAARKYLRLCELVLLALYLSLVGCAIAILHNPTWHEHILRLFRRSWDIFVAQDVGSTSRGILSGGADAILSVFAVAIMTGYLNGFKQFKKQLTETAIVTLFAIPMVTAIVYGTQFAWEVASTTYNERQSLTADQKSARDALAPKEKQIEILTGALSRTCYLPDRHFADTQIEPLNEGIRLIARKFPGLHVLTMSPQGDPESARFAEQISKIFVSTGFRVDPSETHPLPARAGDQNYGSFQADIVVWMTDRENMINGESAAESTERNLAATEIVNLFDQYAGGVRTLQFLVGGFQIKWGSPLRKYKQVVIWVNSKGATWPPK